MHKDAIFFEKLDFPASCQPDFYVLSKILELWLNRLENQGFQAGAVTVYSLSPEEISQGSC